MHIICNTYDPVFSPAAAAQLYDFGALAGLRYEEKQIAIANLSTVVLQELITLHRIYPLDTSKSLQRT